MLLFFFQVSSFSPSISQINSFNFRHLTNRDGLSDDAVHAFMQDRYGFIWIGTSYGLNRFDGIHLKTWFTKPGDSSSLISSYVLSLFCDSKGRLWIGTFLGLSRYDYAANRFINYKADDSLAINSIVEDKKGNIWLGTAKGLWSVDEKKTSIGPFSPWDNPEQNKIFKAYVYEMISSPEGTLYMGTSQGIKIYDPVSRFYKDYRYKKEPGKGIITSNSVYSVALDSKGFLWAACTSPRSLLNRIDLKTDSVKLYDRFLDPGKKWNNNTILRILYDNKGRMWITSSMSGLSLYDESRDEFTDFQTNPYIPGSILTNHNNVIYQDNNGIIWVGAIGYGISFFNPDKNLFATIYPESRNDNTQPDTWCRVACQDKNGNIWLGTGRGVARYDQNWNFSASFVNDNVSKPILHVNSIRSMLEDDQGDIWIGTARGLNRYHPSTGVMDFFDSKQGIPLNFFWMMDKDSKGGVWLGSTWGLYHYIREQNRFDNMSKEPELSAYVNKNVQALFVDSKDRLWIGYLNVGLLIYDLTRKTPARLLTIKDSLISDTRFSSFAEDQDGIIWVGSEEGLMAYDPVKNKTRFFTREDGLPSNRVNNLMVDSMNRIWLGSSNGLCVLSQDRKKIKRFDINDGLLSNHFNEQSACRIRDGSFIYPAYNGFLVFRPENYKENSSTTPVYITSFKITGKESIINTENSKDLKLRHKQNFFNIELAGLNYMNPYRCTYVYKLEPFDEEWITTDKREINYTNVPAGNYTFRYKVITDNADWNVPEKTMGISIRQIFYKTWWFQSLVVLLVIAGLFAFYRYRVHQREKILVLQNKAQMLEKEKTQVMYENLKQHLNPHFLFNSLTSLSSLIRLDQRGAGDFLDKMSKVYRYILKNRDNETVPLSEELKFVELYIQLQKTRFEKGLQVHINIDEEYQNRRIAPVTLQNLVENAIKHNIADTDTPLIIDLFIEDDYLVVRNNLQKKNFVETSNKQGLVNMVSLYKYLGRRPMVIEENAQYFIVKIPLI